MIEAILETLKIIGLLGIVFFILVFVNIACGIAFNMNKGEKFSIRKLSKGIIKALVFYLSSGATAIAFTMLPYINILISKSFKVELLSNELLNTLSAVGVLSIVIAAIVIQGNKALEGIKSLSNISINSKGK